MTACQKRSVVSADSVPQEQNDVKWQSIFSAINKDNRDDPIPEEPKNKRAKILIGSAILLSITLLAGYVRTLNWPQVFHPTGIRFIEGDAHYHMRRAHQAVADNYRVPEFDPWMNFPQGFHCNWTPLLDQSIAFTARLVGGTNTPPEIIDATGAIFPVVMGMLTVLATFFVAKLFMPTRFALIAPLFLCFFPYHIQITLLGRPDHHCAIPLILTLTLLSSLSALQSVKNPKSLLPSIFTGITMAMGMLTWPGYIFICLLVLGGFFIDCGLTFKDSDRFFKACLASALAFVILTGLTLPHAVGSYWSTLDSINWSALTTRHTAFFAGISVFFIVSACVSTAVRKWDFMKKTQRLLILGLLGLGSTFLVIILFSLVDFRMFAGGLSFIAKEDIFLKYVYESFEPGKAIMIQNFTALVFTFPFLLLLLFLQKKQQNKAAIAIVFSFWLIACLILTLRQERFSELLSVPASILCAYAIFVFVKLSNTLAKKSDRMLLAVTGLLVLFIAVRPCMRWFKNYRVSAPLFTWDSLYEICDWLKTETAPQEDTTNGHPSYCVLANWPMGNPIVNAGKRANIANGFVGWEENKIMNLTPSRFFACTDPDEAKTILKEHSVRYVLASEPLQSGDLAMAVDLLELEHSDYFMPIERAGKHIFIPGNKTLRSMAYRLFSGETSGLDFLKPVYKSSSSVQIGTEKWPQTRVYEFIE